jgi:hypothetical protein
VKTCNPLACAGIACGKGWAYLSGSSIQSFVTFLLSSRTTVISLMRVECLSIVDNGILVRGPAKIKRGYIL